MAATAAAVAFSPARVSAAVVTLGSRRQQKETKVVYIRGLNSYGGLKAHNSVASLGMPVCTEQGFANVISSLKASSSNGKGKGGGALSSKCSKIGEIVQIAATLNGLTLLGVAVGFVLLRIEAFVEEAESTWASSCPVLDCSSSELVRCRVEMDANVVVEAIRNDIVDHSEFGIMINSCKGLFAQ